MPFQDYRFLDAILAISAILFCIGLFGFLTRSRIIGLAMMFFGGALSTAAFGEFHGSRSGILLAAAAVVVAVVRISMLEGPRSNVDNHTVPTVETENESTNLADDPKTENDGPMAVAHPQDSPT